MAIEENRLSFSSNGSGVTLHTKFGNLNFNTNEYSYYECLFKIADHHNDGALFLGSSSMVTLLMRTEISWRAIVQAVQIVLDALQSPAATPQHSPPISFATAVKGSGNKANKLLGGNSNPIENISQFTIKFHHWLLLCKLLACHKLKREPLDICFQNVPQSEAELRFKLSKIVHRFTEGEIFKQFHITLQGWKFHGEDYQHQHVKYIIQTVSTLINRTNIHVTMTSEQVIVERRYSEFESLVNILYTHYKGLIIPPLPLKDSRYITPQEVIASRRQHELTLFLQDLNTHPQLRYSFALAVFLESSTNGLRSFFDLYSHMTTNGKLEYTQSKQDSEGVVKFLHDGAAMLHTGVNVLSAHTKSFDFVGTWWNTVSKNVSKLTSPFTTSTAVESFEKQVQFFDVLEKCGKAMDSLLTAEMGRMEESGKLAECFKNISELVLTPDLSKLMLTSSTALLAVNQVERLAHDSQTIKVAIPLSYLGRYGESFRTVIQQRTQAVEAINLANKHEQDAKRLVEITSRDTTYDQQSINKLQQAKVKLGDCERVHEKKITEGDRLLRSIHVEYAQVHTSHRQRILNNLTAFAEERLASTQSSLTQWEALYRSLLNSS